MDKILRYFTIKDEVFYMYSRYEGEFGLQLIVTLASDTAISQLPGEGSAPIDFNFRLGEMQYFIQVYSMFNPQNKVDYGLQEIHQETQKEL